MNPISLVHLNKLFLPSPRSHLSAIGPRSKTQTNSHSTHAAETHTTLLLAAQTGQAGF
jgi:hypothetical protein